MVILMLELMALSGAYFFIDVNKNF